MWSKKKLRGTVRVMRDDVDANTGLLNAQTGYTILRRHESLGRSRRQEMCRSVAVAVLEVRLVVGNTGFGCLSAVSIAGTGASCRDHVDRSAASIFVAGLDAII